MCNQKIDDVMTKELTKLLNLFGVENTLVTLSDIFAAKAKDYSYAENEEEANVCKIISYYLTKAACVEANGYTESELKQIKKLVGIS